MQITLSDEGEGLRFREFDGSDQQMGLLFEEFIRNRGRRYLTSWNHGQGPVISALPGTFEYVHWRGPALVGARAQDDLMVLQVIANDYGIVPLRGPVEAEILHDQYWITSRYFAEQII